MFCTTAIVKNMGSHLSVAETLSNEPILHESECDQTIAALARVLTRALRELGESGAPEAASRLAAQAWVTLRGAHRPQAERLAGVLHYLARLHGDEATVDDGAKTTAAERGDLIWSAR